MIDLTSILTILFIIIFFLTATDKLRLWSRHINTMENYQIIASKNILIVLLFSMVLGEYFVSLSLLFFGVNLYNTGIFLILMFTYTLAIIINLLRDNRHISCGCGSILENDVLSYNLVYRNVGFIIVYIWLFMYGKGLLLEKSILEISVYFLVTICIILLFSILKEYYQSKKQLAKILKHF